MKEFRDKVAVITGAASGIGRGLAERCAQEGMKVVLADVEEEALGLADADLKAGGASTLAVLTDVSKVGEVEALARKTLDAFDAVHLLCNNAGVGTGLSIWESTLEDWQWVIGVNLWGVIHGVHTFVPIMLEQGTECHVVNTASAAGLVSGPGQGIYKVTKHGVVSLSETLFHELALGGANVGVSVLCPGLVDTSVLDSERNRPAELQNDPSVQETLEASPEAQVFIEAFRSALRAGMSPQQVADIVFSALRENRFYILANAEPFMPSIQARLEGIVNERNPTLMTTGPQ